MVTAQDDAGQVVADDVASIRTVAGAAFERLAGRRLLVTGGAGFLGYEMLHAVAAHNRDAAATDRIETTVLDNFVRGRPDWLVGLADEGLLELVEHDITTPLPDKLGALDYIVHAASIASPLFYRKFPIETMDANVGGLRRLLDRAVEQQETGDPVRGFLFFSTSEIYGDPVPDAIPTPETYRGHVSSTGPRACYDESKRFGETLCVNFAQQHGLPVTIARPFNNYGPGLNLADARVIPDFARDILRGEDIVMLSDGSATRTFCYVADAIAGYLSILTHGRPGEPYNIGTAAPEVSMVELAERLTATANDLVGYDGRVVRQESDDAAYLADNPMRRCPVIDKAQAELGYAPSVTLDEGLRRSLRWYRGQELP